MNAGPSALGAAIFGMAGGVAILLAVPTEKKARVVKILPATSAHEYGAPQVPQIEEVAIPEPLERHSVAQAETKTEKQAPRRHKHVVRPRPNFLERLVASFIKLQKHQSAESFSKRSSTTSPRGRVKNAASAHRLRES
jgi:hypothetical protein